MFTQCVVKNKTLFQEHLPPDVGLGHDVLESIAELKKGLNLETHEGNVTAVYIYIYIYKRKTFAHVDPHTCCIYLQI